MGKRVAFIAALMLALALCCACAQQASPSSGNSKSSSDASSSQGEISSTIAESATSPSSSEAVRVMAVGGPAGASLIQLSQDAAYDLRFAGSVDEVAKAVSSQAIDIAAIPTTFAARLHRSTNAGVKLLAVNTYGTLYLLDNGYGISSLADLAGKHVYATGVGSDSQYVFECLLWNAGVEPGLAMDIEYLPEDSELVALAASGEAELALLPEPSASIAKVNGPDDLRVALDIGEQWKAAMGSDLAMNCIVVRAEFADEHPEAVARFLDDLKSSIGFVNGNIDEAVAMCADVGIFPNAEIAKISLPRCSLVCVTGLDAKQVVENYLAALLNVNPESIGGTLPDSSFFY